MNELKAALTKPGAALRQPDPQLPFRLYTDWSTSGIAAVLNQQGPEGVCGSMRLTLTQHS